ncbi:MAG: hypothetical protein AVDCRST_MAG26-911 [uncultured Chloroflexia bacterium]|uniref:Uncharacterized protein n=1 Tax=uncultured Chloroflexia bacterium TaxID=1672391 RepID=A0A6J4HRH8_9CHLR|nr:MAG: hypothetical protein AVDCRST_MAG26-911 [uncultured Chloroflexia bacterium]
MRERAVLTKPATTSSILDQDWIQSVRAALGPMTSRREVEGWARLVV